MTEADKAEKFVPPEFLKELTVTLTELFLKNQQKPQHSILAVAEGSNSPITVKFDGKNYGLWSDMVEIHLKSKNKLGHVSGSRSAPHPTAAKYKQWEIDDNTVKAWLLNSLDPGLLGNFLRFPTAKEVWDAIKTAFFDENDGTQIYELQMRVRGYTQSGGSLEEYYNTLQRLWREIDIRRPNKNICSIDIENRNQEILEERLYIFLGGLDQRLDNIRAEILRTKPFPTIEEAFARVRREDVRQSVMTGRGDSSNPMAVIATDRYNPIWKSGPSLAPKSGTSNSLELITQALGGGTITHNLAHGSGSTQNCVPEQQESIANYAARQQIYPGSSKVTKCTKCGSKKHTIEQCFQVIGYPEWWYELKKKKQGEKGKAKANLVMTGKIENESKLDEGKIFYSSCSCDKNTTWVIDSGATDHMTFSIDDVANNIKPRKNEISNENGVSYPVSGAGDVHLSPSLTLSNTLVVPSLSTKLISVGQLAEDLNCMVLMYPNCCVFQDIPTKEIIGRGIKKGRLYHLEDLKCGEVNLAKG